MNVNASGRGTRNRSNRSWWGAPVGLAAGADGDEYQRPTMTKETTMTTNQGCAGRSFFQRGGAGRGERMRKSTDPKIRQKCIYLEIKKVNMLMGRRLQQGCAGRSFFQRGRAGRGEDVNPRGGPGRGGAKMKIRGAVRGGAGQKSA